MDKYTKKRLPKGETDPFRTCTCSHSNSHVLLFYRYWALEPRLAGFDEISEDRILELASFWETLAATLDLQGKIRLGKEGFNITLVVQDYDALVEACRTHWSFAGLDLQNDRAFFKPSPSCPHAFSSLSIKIVDEIVPLNLNRKLLNQSITYLSPPEFHQLLLDPPEGALLLDARNAYESRLGHFASSRIATVLPPTRRFSDLPTYLAHRTHLAPRAVYSYCTGGIRCEKAARLAAADLSCPSYTLAGGIAAYLAWARTEIDAGRLDPADSRFIGRNMVFDARGSTGLADSTHPGMPCAGCARPTFDLGQCRGTGCALILLECAACRDGDGVWCCTSCRVVSDAADARGGRRRGNCACEEERARRVVDPALDGGLFHTVGSYSSS